MRERPPRLLLCPTLFASPSIHETHWNVEAAIAASMVPAPGLLRVFCWRVRTQSKWVRAWSPQGSDAPRQNCPSRCLPSKDRYDVERPSTSLRLVPLSLPCGAMSRADRAPRARDARVSSLATRPRHTTPMRPPRGARPERFLRPYRGACL